jgi:carbamoyl-phosphate synthase large subunit
MTVHVLLTGAGGLMAHFIRKALLCSGLDLRIVASDHSPNAAGLFHADVGYVVPSAREPDYLPKIIEICKREQIHLIMVHGIVERAVLAQNRELISEHTGAFIVSPAPEVLRTIEDKWELTRYLARGGFSFPRSVLPADQPELLRFLDELPFPYVVKDRFGTGSKGLAIARTKDELDRLLEMIPNPVIQEYLHPDDEEYTVGVFVCSHGKAAASIVMKRELTLGLTTKGQVLPDSELGAYCERIVEGSGCLGPTNVQLRVTRRGPVVFEINARFSSTTSARCYYGYNDAAMCIRHFVLKEAIPRPSIRTGRFFRVMEEVFVEEGVFERLKRESRIDNTRPEAASPTLALSSLAHAARLVESRP